MCFLQHPGRTLDVPSGSLCGGRKGWNMDNRLGRGRNIFASIRAIIVSIILFFSPPSLRHFMFQSGKNCCGDAASIFNRQLLLSENAQMCVCLFAF